ncbi:MAG: hypothetical protein AAGA30_17495, partial [Planctomycetota bacterium]
MNKTTINKTERTLAGSSETRACNFVDLDGESYFKIARVNQLPEFMMSLSSSSNHWMFISSYGALTAGRQNADNALFPYYSADKIVDTRNTAGPLTILRLSCSTGDEILWKPFEEDQPGESQFVRNLYKNSYGNKICFEEINTELGLIFRYRWAFSHESGFVRTSHLLNVGARNWNVDVLDGIQNIMPYGVDQNFQLQYGNLTDAYKKNELLETGVGLFYLSSIPTDRAEPSEGLRATAVWATQNRSGNFFASAADLARDGDIREGTIDLWEVETG